MTWGNKPNYDANSLGAQDIGGWNNNNTWYIWNATSAIKNGGIQNGLMLREYRYTPSCEGSTSPTCRAGASRAGYLNSKEASSNKPQICFYSTGSVTPTVPVCAKNTGDADCQNGVNMTDYNIWKCEYLNNGTCPNPASNKTADFNGSGTVDLVDFEIWRNTYYDGLSGGPPSS
jgi:hypothetical protein